NRAKYVLANSLAGLADLQQSFPRLKVNVLYNLIEPDIHRGNYVLSSLNNKFLSIGSNRTVKNYKYLIELWHLSGTCERLQIIGKDVFKLQSLLTERGIKNIELLDFQEDIITVMSKSKGVIHTSRSEGYSNVLQNAALMGLPVLSTECGGSAKEVLGDATYLTGSLSQDVRILNTWLERPNVNHKQTSTLRNKHSPGEVLQCLSSYLA
ncbi:glycosyltransferase, partial [Akkermansiaceae bacterium]|nr:glycosyltransferase [Akkermansiaceae bacterium]